MPQPTIPAAVRIEQYCPPTQRWLMPMASPPAKCIGRLVVRGSCSFMFLLGAIDDLSADHREPRANGFDALLGAGEIIVAEHRQIAELADFERSFLPFVEAEIGGVARE